VLQRPCAVDNRTGIEGARARRILDSGWSRSIAPVDARCGRRRPWLVLRRWSLSRRYGCQDRKHRDDGEGSHFNTTAPVCPWCAMLWDAHALTVYRTAGCLPSVSPPAGVVRATYRYMTARGELVEPRARRRVD